MAEFDQSNYYGRLQKFIGVTDFRTLFVTDKQLEWAKKVQRDPTQYPIFDQQRAAKMTNAVLHPDTGEKIPLPFRMSAFVPANILIVAGMLAPNQSPLKSMFWQWLNQTYNVALNHCNRNASNEIDYSRLIGAYTGSVTCSVGVALAGSALVKKSVNWTPVLRTTLPLIVPYLAVASAGTLNVGLMRFNELTQGVLVKDKDGNALGRSIVAGRLGVGQVALSRILLPIPILVFPPIIMKAIEHTPLFKKFPKVRTPVMISVIAICLQCALPATIAVFPQTATLPVSSLEPEFQKYKDKGVDNVYFNKGL